METAPRPATEVSVLVRYNGQDWLDVLGRPWTQQMPFSLPDKDVFAISATANRRRRCRARRASTPAWAPSCSTWPSRHLNKHIDYSACCAPVPNAESEKSLAQPLGMSVSSDGATLYVAAFGSSRLGVYSTAALEADTFVPSTANQIELSGGGPTGVVLDEARGRLYVLTRFDNSISVEQRGRGRPAHRPAEAARGRGRV